MTSNVSETDDEADRTRTLDETTTSRLQLDHSVVEYSRDVLNQDMLIGDKPEPTTGPKRKNEKAKKKSGDGVSEFEEEEDEAQQEADDRIAHCSKADDDYEEGAEAVDAAWSRGKRKRALRSSDRNKISSATDSIQNTSSSKLQRPKRSSARGKGKNVPEMMSDSIQDDSMPRPLEKATGLTAEDSIQGASESRVEVIVPLETTADEIVSSSSRIDHSKTKSDSTVPPTNSRPKKRTPSVTSSVDADSKRPQAVSRTRLKRTQIECSSDDAMGLPSLASNSKASGQKTKSKATGDTPSTASAKRKTQGRARKDLPQDVASDAVETVILDCDAPADAASPAVVSVAESPVSSAKATKKKANQNASGGRGRRKNRSLVSDVEDDVPPVGQACPAEKHQPVPNGPVELDAEPGQNGERPVIVAENRANAIDVTAPIKKESQPDKKVVKPKKNSLAAIIGKVQAKGTAGFRRPGLSKSANIAALHREIKPPPEKPPIPKSKKRRPDSDDDGEEFLTPAQIAKRKRIALGLESDDDSSVPKGEVNEERITARSQSAVYDST